MKDIPSWALTLPWNIISRAGKDFSINPKLIGAVIMAESSGDQWSTRFEPNYRWLHKVEESAVVKDDSGIITETMHQKTSWGTMQVMGGLARELGLKGAMPKLCVLTIGIEYGCLALRGHLDRWKNIPDAIAGYNAGSPRDADGDGQVDNHIHVGRVLRFFNDLGGRVE